MERQDLPAKPSRYAGGRQNVLVQGLRVIGVRIPGSTVASFLGPESVVEYHALLVNPNCAAGGRKAAAVRFVGMLGVQPEAEYKTGSAENGQEVEILPL